MKYQLRELNWLVLPLVVCAIGLAIALMEPKASPYVSNQVVGLRFAGLSLMFVFFCVKRKAVRFPALVVGLYSAVALVLGS